MISKDFSEAIEGQLIRIDGAEESAAQVAEVPLADGAAECLSGMENLIVVQGAEESCLDSTRRAS